MNKRVLFKSSLCKFYKPISGSDNFNNNNNNNITRGIVLELYDLYKNVSGNATRIHSINWISDYKLENEYLCFGNSYLFFFFIFV